MSKIAPKIQQNSRFIINIEYCLVVKEMKNHIAQSQVYKVSN